MVLKFEKPYIKIRDGTEIIRWDKNKIINRGLVPLVPAVPANYTIPGREFFIGCATYVVCISKNQKGL